MDPDRKVKLVFVPNRKDAHDYTDAYQFGSLVFCTDGALNRKDLRTMQTLLEEKMVDAEAQDYILLTSLTSLCSIACSIMAARFGRVNVLVFERDKYTPRTLFFERE